MIGNRLSTVDWVRPFVNRPPDAMLLDLLSQHSALAVHRHLTGKGYAVTLRECKRLRKRIKDQQVAA